MKIKMALMIALLFRGCDLRSNSETGNVPQGRISPCPSKVISDYQSGRLVCQQAVVLEDNILFDVIGLRFVENYAGAEHVFGGENSVLNKLPRQMKQSHDGAITWSFILVGDTLVNKGKVNYVGDRLLKAGVPEVCVYQMNDLDVKVSNGFTGLNHLRD